MIINSILLFIGLTLWFLKSTSSISVNTELVEIVALCLIIPNTFLMIRSYWKRPPQEKLIRKQTI